VERLDNRIRRFVYEYIVEHAVAPASKTIARQLSKPLAEVNAALLRLSEAHAVIARRESCEIWRVAPFSAVPTAFEVRVGEKRWWANCVWDALGVLAALNKDGQVVTCCPCCNQAMALTIQNGKLQSVEAVIHFLLPVRQWYEDIVFT
jgi:hypothetical protein